jgi:hypothetical protein
MPIVVPASGFIPPPNVTTKNLVTIEDYKGPFVAVRFTKPLLCHYATPAIMR